MIKDLEMLYDIAPLFKKELVILIAGQKGNSIINEIREMGAGKLGITICDWKPDRWGQKASGIKIISPYMLKEYLQNADLNNIIICIMEQDLNVQDEMLEELENMGIGEPDIYTYFGVKSGIYYNLNSSYINDEYRQKKLIENAIQAERGNSRMYMDNLKYFAFVPLYNDEIIMVYQPGKVGSRSVHASIKRYGRNVVHVHYLQNLKYMDIGIQEVINLKSAKIISLVREPVSRAMSYMWHNMESFFIYGDEHGIEDIEQECFCEGFEYEQENWYNEQMKNLFGIDILEYPFDREKGYQVIKEGNIELLLLKMECLNELAPVIGEFLDIQNFRLYKSNIGEARSYRFAYDEYKKRFSLPSKRLELIFRENKFVKHFYTEEECGKFIQKYIK